MEAVNILRDNILTDVSLAKFRDDHVPWRGHGFLNRCVESILWNRLSLERSVLPRLLDVRHFLPASWASFEYGVGTASVVWDTGGGRETSTSEELQVFTILNKLSQCINFLLEHIWSIEVLLLFILGLVSCVGHFCLFVWFFELKFWICLFIINVVVIFYYM